VFCFLCRCPRSIARAERRVLSRLVVGLLGVGGVVARRLLDALAELGLALDDRGRTGDGGLDGVDDARDGLAVDGLVSSSTWFSSSSMARMVPKTPKFVITFAPGATFDWRSRASCWRFRELRNMKKIRTARTASMMMVNGSKTMGWEPSGVRDAHSQGRGGRGLQGL
jgi:hypothetical protein